MAENFLDREMRENIEAISTASGSSGLSKLCPYSARCNDKLLHQDTFCSEKYRWCSRYLERNGGIIE
ncbi:MAG: hypothetical protein Q7S33_00655 [Nanoarchaeota archaeon]|nr:hypothetical protein [Nanoarchaeota archaeon]